MSESKNRMEGLSEISKLANNNRTLLACAVTAVCGFIAIRRFTSGTTCKSKTKLHGKTVLITGANTGIGKATATDLAKRGARVLIACRNMTKAEAAAEEIRQSTGNQDVVTYKLDLASLKSVRQCATDVLDKEKQLDILINNAEWKTEDGFEMQFGVNHLGHFLFTNLLLDLLKKSAPSRIVTVSSRAHKYVNGLDFEDLNYTKSYNPIYAYSRSKLSNVLFSRELSERLKGSGVTSNSLHPGVVATELVRYAESNTFNAIISFIIKIGHNAIGRHLMKTSIQGAQTSIYCAVAQEVEGVSGKYFSDCCITQESKAAQDDEAASRLWKESEKLVGMT